PRPALAPDGPAAGITRPGRPGGTAAADVSRRARPGGAVRRYSAYGARARRPALGRRDLAAPHRRARGTHQGPAAAADRHEQARTAWAAARPPDPAPPPGDRRGGGPGDVATRQGRRPAGARGRARERRRQPAVPRGT